MCHSPRRSLPWSLVAGCFALALIAGCGESPPLRLEIGGAVTIEETPVAEGSIVFLPTEGQSGPAASTRIVDGRYQFQASDGPFPGTYRVQVQVASPGSSRTAVGQQAGKRQPGDDSGDADVPGPGEHVSPSGTDPPGKADLIAASANRPTRSGSGELRRQWETKVQLDASDPKQRDFHLSEP